MVTSKGVGSGHSDAHQKKIAMSQQGTTADRILEAVRRAPGCQLDELEHSLPGLSWNQVFLEVDRLSRSGKVWMISMGDGMYAVRPPSKEKRP
ncbi:MAG: hypothetical protein ACT4OO_14215 [Nitrospiraceae bacterium]